MHDDIRIIAGRRAIHIRCPYGEWTVYEDMGVVIYALNGNTTIVELEKMLDLSRLAYEKLKEERQ